jgi:hypothetical protein
VHEKGAMDLSRMNDGAPWLWGHDPNKVLGVVEKAWLGEDRRLYSTVRWSPNTLDKGNEEYKRRQDIQAGITRNVSFAYEIKDIDERADGFYGPSPSYQMQAFPSGHAAAVFGTSIPILLSHPLAGAPLAVAASTVGWSRLFLNRHHPTDVVASLLLAILVSVPLRQWLLVSTPR